jgi:hypothetical protein
LTVKKLAAILFIFVCVAVAWFTLGASLLHRTSTSGSELAEHVSQLWGGHHAQAAPTAWYWRSRTVTKQVEETDGQGNAVTREEEELVFEKVAVPLESSQVDVTLDLEHRRKGLLWHDTYSVQFAGKYKARLPENATSPLELHFDFPSAEAIYDNFELMVDGQNIASVIDLSQGATARAAAAPGEEAAFSITYSSRGLDHWRYLFAPTGIAQIRDFSLALDTDFSDIDFVPGTLSPTKKTRSAGGWALDWDFASLVSGQNIGIDLPNKLNPGPLTARITFFAPVSLLFFFTVLVMLGALGHLELHPMHYFFLAAAFFAFHLLLAYLVDHVSINLAFVLSAAVSVGLVVSYLRLVCGLGRAVRYAGTAQFVFLVLFSSAFFFEGYTGLAVTLGAVLTLFVLMQLTGRVDWERAFAERRRGRATELATEVTR